MAVTASGPAALNSDSPTLATPNQGCSSLARRTAATRSSTSRASARRSRTSAGTAVVGSPMSCSYQAANRRHLVPATPPLDLGQHPRRGPGRGKCGGAHLHSVGPGQKQLDGVLTGADASHADDGGAWKGGAAVVDGPDGDG